MEKEIHHRRTVGATGTSVIEERVWQLSFGTYQVKKSIARLKTKTPLTNAENLNYGGRRLSCKLPCGKTGRG